MRCGSAPHTEGHAPPALAARPPPILPQHVATQPNELKIWMLPSGNIICVDQPFFDHLGYTPDDITGTPVASLVLDPAEVERCAAAAWLQEGRQHACGHGLFRSPGRHASSCRCLHTAVPWCPARTLSAAHSPAPSRLCSLVHSTIAAAATTSAGDFDQLPVTTLLLKHKYGGQVRGLVGPDAGCASLAIRGVMPPCCAGALGKAPVVQLCACCHACSVCAMLGQPAGPLQTRARVPVPPAGGCHGAADHGRV